MKCLYVAVCITLLFSYSGCSSSDCLPDRTEDQVFKNPRNDDLKDIEERVNVCGSIVTKSDSFSLGIAIVDSIVSLGGGYSQTVAAVATSSALFAELISNYRCRITSIRSESDASLSSLESEVGDTFFELKRILSIPNLSKQARIDTVKKYYTIRQAKYNQGSGTALSPALSGKILNIILPQQNFVTERTIQGAINIAAIKTNLSGAYKTYLLQSLPGNTLHALQMIRTSLIPYVRGGIVPSTFKSSILGSIYLIGEQIIDTMEDS